MWHIYIYICVWHIYIYIISDQIITYFIISYYIILNHIILYHIYISYIYIYNYIYTIIYLLKLIPVFLWLKIDSTLCFITTKKHMFKEKTIYFSIPLHYPILSIYYSMVTPSNSAEHRSKAWMNGNLWPKVGLRSIQRMLELNFMSDPTHLGGERTPTWKFIQCHGWIFTSIGFHQDVPLAMEISGPFLSPSSAMIHADGHRAPILSAGTPLGFACVGFWWMSFCICALCWC